MQRATSIFVGSLARASLSLVERPQLPPAAVRWNLQLITIGRSRKPQLQRVHLRLQNFVLLPPPQPTQRPSAKTLQYIIYTHLNKAAASIKK